jgi:hypothetical protein
MGGELIEPGPGSEAEELQARGIGHLGVGVCRTGRRDQEQARERKRADRGQHTATISVDVTRGLSVKRGLN